MESMFKGRYIERGCKIQNSRWLSSNLHYVFHVNCQNRHVPQGCIFSGQRTCQGWCFNFETVSNRTDGILWKTVWVSWEMFLIQRKSRPITMQHSPVQNRSDFKGSQLREEMTMNSDSFILHFSMSCLGLSRVRVKRSNTYQVHMTLNLQWSYNPINIF